MKKRVILGISLVLIAVLGIFVVKQINSSEERSNYSFLAVVTEANDFYMFVRPVEGSKESKSCNSLMVPTDAIDDNSHPEVGYTYKIVYDGNILESYPGELPGIISVKLKSKKK